MVVLTKAMIFEMGIEECIGVQWAKQKEKKKTFDTEETVLVRTHGVVKKL